jgi:hypothetical protein
MKTRGLGLALGLLAAGAQAASLGDMVGMLAAYPHSRGEERSIDEALANLSRHMNRKVPLMVDADTRLDRVTAEPGHRLSYHYTLTAAPKKEMASKEFVRLIRPMLQQRLCASSEMKGFLQNGVTIAYVYRGADGKPLGATQFHPADCGYPKT